MNELTHYGVKGMKWGVRRDNPSGGSSSSSSPKTPHTSEDAKSLVESLNKANAGGGIHVLSNKELQTAIARMNLENQYRNLTTDHRNQMDEGLKRAQKILAIGDTVEKARKFMATPTGKAVKTGLGVAFTAAAAYATGGGSAAAKAGGAVVIRRASNHFTNVGN